MADPYKPLVPGDAVTQISRTAYNGFLEMLKWWRTSSKSGTGPLSNIVDWDQSVFLCQNDSGADVDEYGVVGIAGPLITPTVNEREFLSKTPLSGSAPAVGKWAVFLGATPSGYIGKVCVSGVVPVRVYVTAYTDKFCDVVSPETVGSETCYLGSGPSGAQILWWEASAAGDSDTIVWAIVRLGLATAVGLRWYDGTLPGTLLSTDASIAGCTLAAIDGGDDPTGTQTVYNLPLLSGQTGYNGPTGSYFRACLNQRTGHFEFADQPCTPPA